MHHRKCSNGMIPRFGQSARRHEDCPIDCSDHEACEKLHGIVMSGCGEDTDVQHLDEALLQILIKNTKSMRTAEIEQLTGEGGRSPTESSERSERG